MTNLRMFFGIACIAMAGCDTSTAEQGSGVTLALTALGEGRIEYKLSNDAELPVRLVRWRTPLTGTRDDFFSITQQGEPARYRGPAVFRVPSAGDELVLEPGASLATTVDLSETYELAAGAPLEVRSRLRGDQIVAKGETAIDVSSALAHVEPPNAQSNVVSTTAALQGSCSDDDEAFVRTNLVTASSRTFNAIESYDPDSELAQRFFGPGHDQNQVRTTLAQIWRIANSDQLTLMCDDYNDHCGDDGIIAWVLDSGWRTGDWTIHVCGRYWDPDYIKAVDDETYGSAPGALVHELAHLSGAWLEGYGEAYVEETAQSLPTFSVLLGEAYRYYVMYLGR